MQTLVFSLREDLLPVLELVEQGGALHYVRTGAFPSATHATFRRGADLPGIGVADAASAIACASFLVSVGPITLRPTRLRSGIERFCIDQLANPDTVTLTPAGAWSDDVVLHGRVATSSESAVSRDLMKRFEHALKKRFTTK